MGHLNRESVVTEFDVRSEHVLIPLAINFTCSETVGDHEAYLK